MVGRVPRSLEVTVYMTGEEALFAKMECANSQQGSSFEGALIEVLSARALSQVGVSPRGQQVGEEEVDSEDIEVVYSEPKTIEHQMTQGNTKVEPVIESCPREGVLLKNPRSKVTKDELNKLRYLYRIP